LQRLTRPNHIRNFSELPDTLRTLIEESFSLADRVGQLDRAMEPEQGRDASAAPASNPVAAQIALLQSAFGRELRRVS